MQIGRSLGGSISGDVLSWLGSGHSVTSGLTHSIGPLSGFEEGSPAEWGDVVD